MVWWRRLCPNCSDQLGFCHPLLWSKVHLPHCRRARCHLHCPGTQGVLRGEARQRGAAAGDTFALLAAGGGLHALRPDARGRRGHHLLAHHDRELRRARHRVIVCGSCCIVVVLPVADTCHRKDECLQLHVRCNFSVYRCCIVLFLYGHRGTVPRRPTPLRVLFHDRQRCRPVWLLSSWHLHLPGSVAWLDIPAVAHNGHVPVRGSQYPEHNDVQAHQHQPWSVRRGVGHRHNCPPQHCRQVALDAKDGQHLLHDTQRHGGHFQRTPHGLPQLGLVYLRECWCHASQLPGC
mmetsp:Transcript_89049/g.247409  ORF Transcript_89049/g.247409 Transcript_89049/m.247409 type:complete len:291 (+) Transcript_89049:837-1709(+)